MYINEIAKLTGQDLVKQEIMYRLNENTNFVYEIIGDNGCGKTTLINDIKENWINISNGIALSLYAPTHIPANDYDVFKNLIVRKEHTTKVLKNILVESIKDISCVGNSLSSITSELFDYKNKKTYSSDNDAKEEIFIHKINSYITKKDVLFLCHDFEKWDFKSRNLLINIISHNKFQNLSKNVYFIIESTQCVFNGNVTDHKVFHLKNIELDSVDEVIRIFNPDINLTFEQQKQLYNITGGNLDLIKECSVLPIINDRNQIIDTIIEKNIKSKTEYVDDVLLLLKQVAFIGQDVNAILLRLFSDLKDEQYDDALDTSIELKYLKEESDNISFVQTYLYNLYCKCLHRNRKYYRKLSKCFNILYPSRYDMQFQYLFRGGLQEQSKKYLFLFLIQYYRENNTEYSIEHTIYNGLLCGDEFIICKKILSAYKLYKNKQYNEANEILDSICNTKIEFRFEIHYLQALIATNKYNTTDKFQEQIDILQQYTTDDFKEYYPEMYIRNYIILVELYAEIGKDEYVKHCMKEINIYFSKHVNIDSQMACCEQCFKMKANAFYKIELAYNYTKKANEFLKKQMLQNTSFSKYYISILNHSANEIVIGEYEEAYKLLTEAHQLAITNSYLEYIHEDILVNNLVISGYLCSFYTPDECIDALRQICDKKPDAAASVLVQNNLSIFYTLKGEYEIALSILSELYENMSYNDTIDTYYQYYIMNNYGILLWLKNDKNAINILRKSYKICPWSKDVAYFNARIDRIKFITENLNPEDLIEDNSWLTYLYVQKPKTVGKAWKFWSSLMIFSELQIWSDY